MSAPLLLDIRRAGCLGVDGRPVAARRSTSGELERVRLGDVEAVQKPVADEVEVGARGGARVAREGAQQSEGLGGVALGLEHLAS